MQDVLFQEEQYVFGGVLPIFFMAVFIVITIARFRLAKSSARVAGRYNKLTFGIIALVSLVVVPTLATLHLETRYYPSKVEYRFASILSPVFGGRYEVISLDSVVKVSVITYDPSDYGGWGMKGNEYARAYTAAGNNGVMFTFRRGKQFLLGTAAADSLRHYLPSHYPF